MIIASIPMLKRTIDAYELLKRDMQNELETAFDMFDEEGNKERQEEINSEIEACDAMIMACNQELTRLSREGFKKIRQSA